jgi:hypothetical protein
MPGGGSNNDSSRGDAQAVSASNSLTEHAAVIRALGKRVVGDIIEIGRRLTDAKKIAGHGNWLPWLEREFGWSVSSAENFINVHKLAGKFPTVGNLEMDMRSLYALAAPSTPDEARDEIIDRAANGETFTQAQIKEMITQAKAETEQQIEQRIAAVRAEYVPGSWTRKPPPEPVTNKGYYLQFLRTKCHPFTEIVPLMDDWEFARLVKSIKSYRQVDPIILVEFEGDWVILDGRCREIACGIAGVEPVYRKIEVADPAAYFLSTNFRTDLTRDQLVMFDAITTKPDVDEQANDPEQPLPPIVAARYVLARCKPFADAVLNGSMRLRDAYDRLVDDAWRAAP